MSRVFISRLFVSAIKIINLNTCIFSNKIMIVFIFEINSNNIYIAMALIKQDITILLQAIILNKYTKILAFV